ncbi:MAG: hypothetical protein K6G11_07855 [Lachnospiraceae bacterium]|nr:hypothetical protein [Lachnospiraceae bacterium]
MKCFDIHTHILPGIDDGSKSMEMTIELLKQLSDEGVTDVIATPHYDTHHNRQDYDNVIKLYEAVKEQAKSVDPNLNVYSGCEILYSKGILEDIKNKKVPMLAESNHCLVEFYPRQEYYEIENALNELLMLGKTPVIAHLERYECFYKKTDRVSEVIKMGALVQINSSSFNCGRFNKTARFVKKLLLNGQIHFVGTDCHDPKNRRPLMKSTVKYIESMVGERALKKIIETNPTKLVSGEYI